MNKFFRFVKIEHTLFSLPVVFSGTFLALNGRSLTFREFWWIALATFAARSAGFGFNRILDGEIDAKNERTKGREIPSGQISRVQAWVFTWANAALFVFCASRLSALCAALSVLPLTMFFVYPFLKRKTVWCHLGLGLAWGVAPMGGWLAVSPQIFPFSQMMPGFLLSGFCVFWVAGFDIVYALLDEKFDRENGVFSMPGLLGAANALRLARIFHFISILFLGTLVQSHLKGPVSFMFLGISGALLSVSHFRVENEPLSPPVIDFAFFKVNAALAFVIFLMVFISGGQI